MTGVAFQPAITHPRPAAQALHAREDLLDWGATLADRLVALGLPMAEPMMLVGSVHQPVLGASLLERGAALFGVVSLIGIDRGFVAADQLVGRYGVVDVGGGEKLAADQA